MILPAGPGSNPYPGITGLTGGTGFEPAFDLAAAVAGYLALARRHFPLKEHTHA